MSGRRERQGRRLAPIVAAGAAVAVVFALAQTASPRAVALAIGTLLTLFCFGGAAAYATRNRRRDLFAPPVLILSYLGLGMGIKGLVDLVGGATKISAVIDPQSPEFAGLMSSVFLHTLLGVLGLLFGYEAAAPRHTRGSAVTPYPPLDRRRVAATLAAGVGVTVMAVSLFVARLGSVILTDPSYVAVEGTYGLFWLYPLMYLALFAWVLPIVNEWSMGRPAATWQLAGLGITALIVYTLTSSKSSLVNAALLLIVCRHYAVRPVRVRTLLVLTAVFLVALPVLYLHRQVGVSPELIRRLDLRTLAAGAEIFIGRSYLADSFAAILLYTPRVYPYQYGAPWLELFYFWIPRAWWPTKPITFSIGFGETYFSSYDPGRLSYLSPTLPGDAFINFGTLGVLLVFVLVGVGLRRWYDATVGSRPRPETVLLYAASVYWLAIGSEQSFGNITTLMLSYVAPVALLMVAARGRRPAPLEVSGAASR